MKTQGKQMIKNIGVDLVNALMIIGVCLIVVGLVRLFF